MAAQAWTLYNRAKFYIGNGTVDLDSDVFYIALFKSTSNFATATLSTFGSLTNEVASGNGYSTSGKTLSATTWATGGSAEEYRFDSTAVIWTATGGSLTSIQGAVIFASGGQLVAYSSLSSSAFAVSTGNTLTITPSANGIFELN
jgi:hypothetical protein